MKNLILEGDPDSLNLLRDEIAARYPGLVIHSECATNNARQDSVITGRQRINCVVFIWYSILDLKFAYTDEAIDLKAIIEHLNKTAQAPPLVKPAIHKI